MCRRGVDNTIYFHLILNSKHRRKRIVQLEQDEGTIIGQDNLKFSSQNIIRTFLGRPYLVIFRSLRRLIMT
jgi:hypothetical protein